MLKNPISFILLILIIAFNTNVVAQELKSELDDSLSNKQIVVKEYIPSEQEWVDSVFSSLNMREKIGQLFMIRAHSNKTKAYHEKVADDIRNNKVGGVCFFQGGPIRQINLVNYYQEIAQTPLFVAIDGEWGISMRLDSVKKYPRQMTLGALQNDSLIYQMGVQIAEQCNLVGVNINFAPVVDVNNNPRNPVINSRSFGEQPDVVGRKALAYAEGMQSQSVMAVAKHFPGHGDTDADSHVTLPTITASKSAMDSIHLPPFRTLIDHKIGGVMVAHLYIPAMDSTKEQASSLSPTVINGLLKNELGFKGLAFTDALEMKGVSDYNKPGALEVKALLAGNDILLMPKDVSISIEAIENAITEGVIERKYIDAKVRKILTYKYQMKLYKSNKLNTKDIYSRLNTPSNKALIKEIYRQSITLIKNDSNILPLTTDSKKSMAVVTIGFSKSNSFSRRMQDYRKVDLFHLDARSSLSAVKGLVKQVEGYDIVVICITKTTNSARRNYGIYQSSIDFANLIAQKTKVVIDIHGNPYSLSRFTEGCQASAVLVSYQDYSLGLEASAEALFGGYNITGKLPVSASKKYPANWGLHLKKKRISFGSPEELGISSDSLSYIDTIVEQSIDSAAFPGCQVLVAKDGMIIYNRAFGHSTYSAKDTVGLNSIYDLASVTKVMATTLAVMRLSEEKKIDVDRPLKYYLPELDSTNKGDIIIRDLMSHQAQLKPWIPFFLHSMENKNLNPELYRSLPKKGFQTQVADNLFILDSYKDSIWNEIVESDLLKKKKYRYSDLGYYLLQRIIEQQTGQTLDEYVNHTFYQPLGLQHTGFLPLMQFDSSLIIPTEDDKFFRNQIIKGYVHDQGSAMMGGVAGHAGLFSNSLDVAILAQMLVQNGIYGGTQYIDSNQLEDFTRQQFPLNSNRRGLGFDKPLPDPSEGGPTCALVSSQSYGHSGFTGTYFWVDPKYNLVYVFLSNRVYPDAENRKLINMDIRTRIQEVIYKSIGVEE